MLLLSAFLAIQSAVDVLLLLLLWGSVKEPRWRTQDQRRKYAGPKIRKGIANDAPWQGGPAPEWVPASCSQ